MRPTSRKARLPHVDAYYQSGLFGDDQIAPPDSGAGDSDDVRFEKSSSYWIKKSAEQTVDKFGRAGGVPLPADARKQDFGLGNRLERPLQLPDARRCPQLETATR